MCPAIRGDSDPFCGRLKAARERRGWSQAELAGKAGFQPSAISRFETGAAKPSFDNLRRLAEALAVSTDYLLALTDDPVPAVLTDLLSRRLAAMTDKDRAFAQKLLDALEELSGKEGE